MVGTLCRQAIRIACTQVFAPRNLVASTFCLPGNTGSPTSENQTAHPTTNVVAPLWSQVPSSWKRRPLRTAFGHVCVQTKNALCRFLAKTTERGCAARLGLPQARCSTTNQRCRPLDVILAPTVDVWKPACTRETHQTLNAFSTKCTHVVFQCSPVNGTGGKRRATSRYNGNRFMVCCP